MSYLIENKLVIAIASSAIFDLSESDKVFREEGEKKYKEYQRENKNILLKKGVAFPFIRRLLNLNNVFKDELPVEVVLLSRNAPETGLRVFNSIREYGLNITRAAFLSGKSPNPYIPAFNVSLFLSANPLDVKNAINAEYPAGMVITSECQDDENDKELRVAFDFDGVIVNDEAESIFQKNKNLNEFNAAELRDANVAHKPGPLNGLFVKLSSLQQLEKKRELQDKNYSRLLRTAIVTARCAPAHERVVTTLMEWGVEPDETFFLGGIDKSRILEILKPHIFFDDQITHLESSSKKIPSVHIPFGITNC